MTDANVNTPTPGKRRGWLRVIAWGFGLLVVMLVAVYFVATSGAFFKGMILPRVGKAINAEVTVSDASISPFSQVVLHNLKVQTTGTEPLVTAAEVRLRYSLMDIIGGNMHVAEVSLASATVTLVENADGTSNLDPILKSQQAKPGEKKPEPAAKAPGAKPLQVDLKKLALTDATIRQVKNHAKGAPDTLELTHVNVTLDDVKNGQTGKLGLAADIRVENTNGVLQGKLGGTFALALTADLKPASIKGNTRLDISRAEGALAELTAFGSELDVEITPTDIKGVALRFQKGDTRLGELRVAGPFDMAKLEGRLSIELTGIDKRLLNLAGARNGMDFGGTLISSTNEVELAKGGSVITASGRFDVTAFQLTRTNQTTPRLDLRKEYSVTVDRGQNLATLRRLTVTGLQDGKTLLKAELTSPMQISWGNVSNAVGDSALTFTVADLNLADWKPFMGDSASAGIVNATAKVLSQQGGQQVTFDLDSRIDKLAVNAGSNHIADATVTLQASGKASEMNKFNLTSYKLTVARQNQTLTSVSGSGTYDKASETADMQIAVQAALAPLLQALPQPDMSVASGTVDLKAHITQKQKAQAVTGSLALADFTGRFGKNEVRSLGTAVDFDVAMTPQQIQIRKSAGKLTQGASAAGSFDLSGTYDPETQGADLQVAVRAALASLLQALPQPDLSVASGTVDLKAHITQKQKAQAVIGSLALADFTGRFGKNELHTFGVAADVDAAMTPQQIQLRKAAGKLTQGANAGGSFELSATYDLTNKTATLTAKLVNLNQSGIGPFLEPLLADKQLVSVALNATASAQYDPKGASALKADFQMANLVVKDPKNQFPATPLEAKLQVDASLNKQVADVRQFAITLTPTARAINQVQLSGQVDMTQTNAIQGNLKLAADSLDFTSYYDLFMGGQKTSAQGAAATGSPTARGSAPADANKEPEAIKLPLRNFVASASIGRLYLREVVITNWQTTVKIDSGHVVLNPFKLALNGAPVSTTMDLDLGVPGWKYDVSLSAQAIPLAPLVNSFQPERKGQVGGTVTAQGQVTGAGTAGASLQKNLAGKFDVTSTNLNLNVVNIKSAMLKSVINVVAGIPELLKNPAGGLSAIIGGLTGKAGTSGGLADDLQKSPIDVIIAHGTIGAGRVDLQQATVQSRTFKADASGTLTLAAVLTNSAIQIPVAVSLSQPIAQRMNLVPANTPTNAAYVKLPDFLTMRGTIGEPKTDIKHLALVGTVVQGITGSASGAGGVLGNILDLVKKPAATTNQPPANQSPVNSLIDSFFGPKKK